MKLPRRLFKRLVIAFGLIAVVFVVFVWVAAGYLVYPPRRALQDYHREWLEHAAEHGIAVESFSVLDRRVPCLLVSPDTAHGPGPRGTLLRTQLAQPGWKPDDYGTVCGTLVLLHGREGRKEDLLPVAERFAAAGFRCILADLPAHGDSPVAKSHFGTGAFERNLAGDVLKETAARFHFEPAPAGLWGMSMGGSFAVNAAAAQPQLWNAMVLVCTFDTLSGVERDRLRHWFGPLAPIVGPAVDCAIALRGGAPLRAADSIGLAKGIALPVLVAHGDSDTLISLARGENLYDAFPGPNKKWVTVKGAEHGTILITPMPLYSEMSAWYLRWMNPRAKKAEMQLSAGAGD